MDPPPIQYATTSDGMRIAYAVSGDGPQLLLLPNAWSHIQLFWKTPWRRSLFEALAERFTLIQFDARGQGLSTRGLGSNHTAESYVLDLDAVVSRLRLGRFALLARNLFCQVALLYAVQRSEHLQALILDNPVKDLYEGFSDLRTQRWDLYTETIARLANLPHDPSEIASQFRAAITQADHMKLVDTLRWPEAWLDVSQVHTPTLVIDSSTSPLHAHDWAAQLAAALPQAQFVTLADDEGGSGAFSATSRVPAQVPVIEQFIQRVPAQSSASGNALSGALSSREIEVLRLIAAGKSNQQIADELTISYHTVGRHVSNILGKIGAANRTQAAAYARDHGF